MAAEKLIKALRGLAVNTGSLACLGCGYEHRCALSGCAILRKAADAMESLQAERDAALKDLRRLGDCDTCLHNKPEGYDGKPCTCCMRGEKWQWRGLRKESARKERDPHD